MWMRIECWVGGGTELGLGSPVIAAMGVEDVVDGAGSRQTWDGCGFWCVLTGTEMVLRWRGFP